MIRTLAIIAAAAAFVFVAVWALILWPDRDTGSTEAPAAKAIPTPAGPVEQQPSLSKRPRLRPPAAKPQSAAAPVDLPDENLVAVAFKKPPQAGMLFDVGTGKVLWSENAQRRLPIASLTKMMTGLMIAESHVAQERVLISDKASRVPGSGVGILPRGKRVPLGPLLTGLMLVSGNDAAVALAEHDAGTAPAFVARMNLRAKELGLDCTRFSTPNGLRDHGNYSCAEDLAQLARLDLANPTLRALARRHDASLPFPVEGGKVHLTNNNPFILKRTPGITGLKTGYTSRAGRCYVITAKRGDHELGVVLLNSPDPLKQVPQLLEAGFDAPV